MREKIGKKGNTKRLFSVALALAVIVALLPLTSLTAYAAQTGEECKFCHHDYGSHVDQIGSTLANNFSEVGGCNDCDGVAPCKNTPWGNCIGHSCGNLSHKNAQDPTCTEDGWLEYWICSCGKVYAANSTTGTAYESEAAWKSGDGKIAKGHIWGYSASGATLTAICTRNSAHTATLELTATSPYYSGSAAKVEYGPDQEDAWKTALGVSEVPEIKYYKEGGTTPTDTSNDGAAAEGEAPSKAGKYVAKATYKDTTVTPNRDYTISLNFEVKNHNWNIATSTMTGITLDNENLSFDVAKTVVNGISGYKPQNGDMVAFAYESGSSEYKVMKYGNNYWDYTGSSSYMYSFERLKDDVTAGDHVYVLGTVQEAHSHTFATAWSSDAVNHWHACTASGHNADCLLAAGAAKGAHGSWNNGKCGTCNYACLHNGATTGICSICKKNLDGGSGSGGDQVGDQAQVAAAPVIPEAPVITEAAAVVDPFQDLL